MWLIKYSKRNFLSNLLEFFSTFSETFFLSLLSSFLISVYIYFFFHSFFSHLLLFSLFLLFLFSSFSVFLFSLFSFFFPFSLLLSFSVLFSAYTILSDFSFFFLFGLTFFLFPFSFIYDISFFLLFPFPSFPLIFLLTCFFLFCHHVPLKFKLIPSQFIKLTKMNSHRSLIIKITLCTLWAFDFLCTSKVSCDKAKMLKIKLKIFVQTRN